MISLKLIDSSRDEKYKKNDFSLVLDFLHCGFKVSRLVKKYDFEKIFFKEIILPEEDLLRTIIYDFVENSQGQFISNEYYFLPQSGKFVLETNVQISRNNRPLFLCENSND